MIKLVARQSKLNFCESWVHSSGVNGYRASAIHFDAAFQQDYGVSRSPRYELRLRGTNTTSSQMGYGFKKGSVYISLVGLS
jgi:hypothetical protein